jgi:hypothetical protein
VDEVIAFTATQNQVVVADPADAFHLLASAPTGAAFFATGTTIPLNGVVTEETTYTNRIMTGIDHRGKNWRYLRVYDSSASGSDAAGQVAQIDYPTGLGNGYIDVARVWNTGSQILGTYAETYMNTEAPHQDYWFNAPRASDSFILVEGTRFWHQVVFIPGAGWEVVDGTPALFTVHEVLGDTQLCDLNTSTIKSIVDDTTRTLNSEAGDALAFARVPVVYVGRTLADFKERRTAIAFSPGLANLQVINGSLYFPRQFGPRNAAGSDIFETITAQRLSAARFVDDWDLYHRLEGEVHCGSTTKGSIPAGDWWESTP